MSLASSAACARSPCGTRSLRVTRSLRDDGFRLGEGLEQRPGRPGREQGLDLASFSRARDLGQKAECAAPDPAHCPAPGGSGSPAPRPGLPRHPGGVQAHRHDRFLKFHEPRMRQGNARRNQCADFVLSRASIRSEHLVRGERGMLPAHRIHENPQRGPLASRTKQQAALRRQEVRNQHRRLSSANVASFPLELSGIRMVIYTGPRTHRLYCGTSMRSPSLRAD